MKYRPSPRYREYVEKVMACGHWIDAEQTMGNHAALLEHVGSGATVGYGLHDGGNDQNGPRNFAKDAQRICGCAFIEHRNRRRSRKRIDPQALDPQVEKARKAARRAASLRAAENRERRRGRELEDEIRALREACHHASTALREQPNDPRLKAAFHRLREQLAQLIQEAA